MSIQDLLLKLEQLHEDLEAIEDADSSRDAEQAMFDLIGRDEDPSRIIEEAIRELKKSHEHRCE